MPFAEILILSLALSADAFTVGTSIGLRHNNARQIFRLSFHFGLFQSLLALIGALAGSLIIVYLQDYDHWIVFALLAFIGVRMIYGALTNAPDRLAEVDLTRGLSLIGLSLAVSMDALAAGIGLSAFGGSLTLAIAMIGLVAALATLLAMLLAGHIGRKVGKLCEVAAGLVLIGLGIWAPISHLELLKF
jgi:manganese efflux pump family protein